MTAKEMTAPGQAAPPAVIDRMPIEQIGKYLLASGFFADIKSEAQAIVKVMAGRQMGIGAVASMSGIYIIPGGDRRPPTVMLGAGVTAALIKRHPHYDYRIVTSEEKRDKECEIEFLKDGQPIGTSLFTMEHAERAALTGKDVWKKYPRNMLFNRALTNGSKWFCRDAVTSEVAASGLGSPQLTAAADQTEAATDDKVIEGEVVLSGPQRPEKRGQATPVVTQPPEGDKSPWTVFWTEMRDLGLTNDAVHIHYGEDMSATFEENAKAQGMTLGAYIVEQIKEMKELYGK